MSSSVGNIKFPVSRLGTKIPIVCSTTPGYEISKALQSGRQIVLGTPDGTYDVSKWTLVAYSSYHITMLSELGSYHGWDPKDILVFIGKPVRPAQVFINKPGLGPHPGDAPQRPLSEVGDTLVTSVPSSPIKAPKNNDGRPNCWWCGLRTNQVDTGFKFYDICPTCGR